MKKTIVITSIFYPTEAVQEFAALNEYDLIVVGDKKTPNDWQCENVNYLSVDNQNNTSFALAKVLPHNHYCRKMLGYLTAIQNGADFIIDTDDDNIPKSNWDFPAFENTFDYVANDKGFVNIYQWFTEQKIWPRGLPLKEINTQYDFANITTKKQVKVGIWQGLADEDPDVDAIYRLTNDTPCYFNEANPIVLGNGTICPFNTQNTIITKELFALMYLPTYVTFRFTDILRGLVAQPIMWLHNYQLGFCKATVVQKRNPHDYMKDFISEIPMYENCEKVIEVVTANISAQHTITDNLYNAYDALLQKNIIVDNEMITLNAWLKDLDTITS